MKTIIIIAIVLIVIVVVFLNWNKWFGAKAPDSFVVKCPNSENHKYYKKDNKYYAEYIPGEPTGLSYSIYNEDYQRHLSGKTQCIVTLS